jgi:hypothetical protein
MALMLSPFILLVIISVIAHAIENYLFLDSNKQQVLEKIVLSTWLFYVDDLRDN